MSERPPGFEVKFDRRLLDNGRGEAAVVAPVGDIDLATAEEFAVALRSPRTSEVDGVVLDLRGVTFMDSSGLRVTLMAAQMFGDRFATVIPAGSPVAMLVDLAEVAQRVNAVSDVDEALVLLARASPEDGG